jgi:hypothetical protein
MFDEQVTVVEQVGDLLLDPLLALGRLLRCPGGPAPAQGGHRVKRQLPVPFDDSYSSPSSPQKNTSVSISFFSLLLSFLSVICVSSVIPVKS